MGGRGGAGGAPALCCVELSARSPELALGTLYMGSSSDAGIGSLHRPAGRQGTGGVLAAALVGCAEGERAGWAVVRSPAGECQPDPAY